MKAAGASPREGLPAIDSASRGRRYLIARPGFRLRFQDPGRRSARSASSPPVGAEEEPRARSFAPGSRSPTPTLPRGQSSEPVALMSRRLPDGTPVEHSVLYPFWVRTAQDRLRFDLCIAIASDVMNAPAESAEVWGAARVLFCSDLPI